MLSPCPCRPRCSCRECFVTRSLDDDDSLACYHAGAIIIVPAGSGICRTGYTRIVREVALPSGAGCTCSPCNNRRICERLTDKLHALAATIQPPVPGRAWRLFFLIVHTALRVKVSCRMRQIISAECHPWDVVHVAILRPKMYFESRQEHGCIPAPNASHGCGLYLQPEVVVPFDFHRHSAPIVGLLRLEGRDLACHLCFCFQSDARQAKRAKRRQTIFLP